MILTVDAGAPGGVDEFILDPTASDPGPATIGPCRVLGPPWRSNLNGHRWPDETENLLEGHGLTVAVPPALLAAHAGTKRHVGPAQVQPDLAQVHTTRGTHHVQLPFFVALPGCPSYRLPEAAT